MKWLVSAFAFLSLMAASSIATIEGTPDWTLELKYGQNCPYEVQVMNGETRFGNGDYFRTLQLDEFVVKVQVSNATNPSPDLVTVHPPVGWVVTPPHMLVNEGDSFTFDVCMGLGV